MKCTSCGIDVPSSYMKCPSCGHGFHGVNTPSSFNGNQIPQQSTMQSTVTQGSQSTGLISGGMQIGGWLILPAIFLPFGIISLITQVIKTYQPLLENQYLFLVFSSGSTVYNPAFGLVLIAEILMNIFLIFYTCKVAFHFYKKSRFLPSMYINLLIYSAILQVVDLIITGQFINQASDAGDFKDLAKAIVGLVVWGLYFKKSERVKNTFVN